MKKSYFLSSFMSLSFVLATLSGAGAAYAQNVGSGQTGGSVAFVREAGSAGYFEIQAAGTALERSQNVGVRGYASRAFKDATEMVHRIKFINDANVGAPMPRQANDAQQSRLTRLASLSGADFDLEYMRLQVEIGEDLARIFRAYGANGESPTLRVYAAKSASDYDDQVARARTVAGSLR